MEQNFSKDSFLTFVTMAEDKALFGKSTLRVWRAASSKLLNDLSIQEEEDLRNVDLDMAVHKLANRGLTLSPSSLKKYTQQLSNAIDEFVSWRASPADYKPRGFGNKSSAKNGKVPGSKSEKTKKPSNQSSDSSAAMGEATPSTNISGSMSDVGSVISSGLSLSFPLRPDFLAQVVVPRDMNSEESRRLGAFLKTLAVDFKPD